MAHDSSGAGNDGEVSKAERVKGKIGNALRFNGKGTFVEVLHNKVLTPETFTIETWVNPESIVSDQWGPVIVSKYGGNYKGYLLLLHGNTGRPRIDIATPEKVPSAVSPDALNVGTWYFLVGTYDGKTAKIYVNGDLKSSMAAEITHDDEGVPLTIGAASWCDGGYFTGIIDEVKIYNYALTEEEIKKHYSSLEKVEAPILPRQGNIEVEVTNYLKNEIIYHSPETPGYTAWVGLWEMPNGYLQYSFVQVTGPKEKPTGSTPLFESRDGAVTWNLAGDAEGGTFTMQLKGGFPFFWFAGRGNLSSTIVLRDGTFVRAWWGSGAHRPKDSGYIRRSTDGGKTWGEWIYFISPDDYKTWPERIRMLRDGRLVLMAGVLKRGDDIHRMTKMMFVSKNDGKTWSEPVILMPTEMGVCQESDFCELSNGDLFWIHRVEHFPTAPVEIPALAVSMGAGFPNGYSDRMQSIVRKKGDRWIPEFPVPAPFPHSGFPEVLLTKEGVILHLATNGSYWSADTGKTWTMLPIGGTGYYPKAVQLSDGKIVCIGHRGSDDAYGTVDQAILQQTFYLKVRQ